MSRSLRKSMVLLLLFGVCLALIGASASAEAYTDEAETAYAGLTAADTAAYGAGGTGDNTDAYAALKTACESGASSLDISNTGAFTIRENLTVPSGLAVSAANVRITVPSGVTLTVYGNFNPYGLVVENGGKVIVDGSYGNNGGHMDIPVEITLNGEGALDLRNRAFVDTGIPSWKKINTSRIICDSTSGFGAHYEAQSEADVQAVYTDILDGKLNEIRYMEPFVEVRFPWTLDKVNTCLSHIRLRTYAGFTIPAGKTFTVSENGILAIFNQSLMVNGNLVNNGEIRLNGPIAERGSTGRYSGSGRIFRNGQPFTLLTEKEINDQIEAALINGTSYLELPLEIAIDRDLRVNSEIRIENNRGKLIIPSGRTITVASGVKFKMNKLEIQPGGRLVLEDQGRVSVYNEFAQNGTITFGKSAYLHIPGNYTGSVVPLEDTDINMQYYANNAEELAAMKAEAEALTGNFHGDLQILFDWHVTEKVSFDRVHITLDNAENRGRGITVEAGGRLTINSGAYVKCADVTVNSGGAIVNNSNIDMRSEGIGRTGTLYFAEPNGYEGNGAIVVFDIDRRVDNPDNHIVGLNLSFFNRYDQGSETAYVRPENALDGLRAAIDSGMSDFDITGAGYVVFDGDMTIPGSMSVNAGGVRLIVPDGVTLTVCGEFLFSRLTVENGGRVVVDGSQGGYAHIDMPKEVTLNGTLELKNHAFAETSIDAWKAMDKSKVICDDTSGFGAHYETQSEAEILSAYTDIRNGRLNELSNMEPFVEVRFPWTVNQVTEVLPHIRLRPRQGMTIPDGKTFTVNGILAVLNQDLVINGNLINSGEIRFHGPIAVMGTSGSYTAKNGGFATRNGELYEIVNSEDAFAALKQAVQRGDSSIDLSGHGNITVTESLTIPAGMLVTARDSGLVIPNGVTLTVKGNYDTNAAIIKKGGKIVINGGNMNITHRISIESTGSFTLKNHAWVDTGIESWKGIDTSRIVCDSTSGFGAHYEARNENDVLAAYDDILAGKLNEISYMEPFVEARFPWTLNQLGAVLPHIRLRTYQGLTLPEGRALTVNGILAVFNQNLAVNGNLVNNGEIRLNGPTASLGPRGSYGGSGSMVRNGEPFSLMSQHELVNGLEQALQSGTDYYELPYTVTIDRDLRVDHNIRVENNNGKLIIPGGRTLTVAPDTRFELHNLEVQSGGRLVLEDTGYLNVFDNFAQYGSLTLGDNVRMHLPSSYAGNVVPGNNSDITLHYKAESVGQLYAMLEESENLGDGFHGDLQVRFDWHINGDVRFERTHLTMDNRNNRGRAITIEQGGRLTLDSGAWIKCADLTVNGGTLVNNNWSVIELVNDGDGVTGSLIFNGSTASYEGSGTISVRDIDRAVDDPDNHIVGLDLSGFERTDRDNETVYVNTRNVLDGLREAIANGWNNYDMNNYGTITLTEDFRIPRNMYIDFWGTNLIIPAGRKLTLEGNLNGEHLSVNGELAIEGSGFLYAATVEINSASGHIKLRDWAQIHTEYYNSPDVRGSRVTFDSSGEHNADQMLICLITDTNDDNAFNTVFNAFKGLPERYEGKIRVRYDKVLSSDLDAFNGKSVQIEVRDSLTVNQGATLSVGFLDLFGGNVTVNGKLVNYGEVKIQPDYDWNHQRPAGRISFAGENSYLSQGGWFSVQDAQDDARNHIVGINLARFDVIYGDYGVYFRDYDEADLILPPFLTTIEEEAFANGTFRSVFIPDSVTRIADNAFNGMTGLAIYGSSSTAQQFAESHGFAYIAR